MIIVETSMGNFSIALDHEAAPLTCENFLSYVRSGFYDGTIFHRVIKDFMVQGGGFDVEMLQKPSQDPVENEAHQTPSNTRGTVAMARTNDPHSATSQFFINVRDNDFLDFRAKDNEQWGYCVFAKVVDGMDVIDKITELATADVAGHQNVPTQPVLINTMVES